MYTLKLLAPIIVGLCAEGLATGQGDHCVIDQQRSNVVKYYQPGKSCYVNGTFYHDCTDSPGVQY